MAMRVGLFVVLVLLIGVWLMKPAPSDSDGWWGWATRDVADVPADDVRAAARYARQNLEESIERGGLPAALGELWTWLSGDSVEGGRWGLLLAGMLGVAVMVRLMRRLPPRLTVGVLGAGCAVALAGALLTPPDPWPSVIAGGAVQRRYDLRAGTAIDLGWRAFDPERLQVVLSRLDPAAPVWLIGDDTPNQRAALAQLSHRPPDLTLTADGYLITHHPPLQE
jgi:hypothetical protein